MDATLKDVERETRISRVHLRALEEEKFESLPPLIYQKGIVRAYAAYLGLDPARLLRMFEEALEKSEVEDHSSALDAAPAIQDMPSHWSGMSSRLNGWTFAVLFALAVAALTNWLFGTGPWYLSDEARSVIVRFWWVFPVFGVAMSVLAWLEWRTSRQEIDPRLDEAALVKLSRDLRIGVGRNGGDILISGWDQKYANTRDVERHARSVLEEYGALILRGPSGCGKTTIAASIISDDPRALVIQPFPGAPPVFSSKGLANRTIYLFLDDLHDIGELDARAWWNRIRNASDDRARLIATTLPGEHWILVKKSMRAFVRSVGDESIVEVPPLFRRAEHANVARGRRGTQSAAAALVSPRDGQLAESGPADELGASQRVR